MDASKFQPIDNRQVLDSTMNPSQIWFIQILNRPQSQSQKQSTKVAFSGSILNELYATSHWHGKNEQKKTNESSSAL